MFTPDMQQTAAIFAAAIFAAAAAFDDLIRETLFWALLLAMWAPGVAKCSCCFRYIACALQQSISSSCCCSLPG